MADKGAGEFYRRNEEGSRTHDILTFHLERGSILSVLLATLLYVYCSLSVSLDSLFFFTHSTLKVIENGHLSLKDVYRHAQTLSYLI
jgi:hypothetical protein